MSQAIGHDWDELWESTEREAGLSRWITAEYDGRCPCGQRWEPGDQIRYSEDEGSFVCETCGSPE
jgi:hypothetical protein